MLRRRNKILKYKINKFKRKAIFWIGKHKKLVIFVSLVLIFFVILRISYLKYIDNSNNIITKIYFNKKVLTNPNFSNLCDYISDTFS
jgi:hypothetical protein